MSGVLLLALVAGLAPIWSPALVPPGARAEAATPVHPGLAITPVVSGLDWPVAARFAPDGSIYVAEKAGLVRHFDGPGDPTSTVALDLRTPVHDYADRGLLGLALDPRFGADRPYLYVLYVWDHDPFGSTAVPRWGDTCATPPGGNTDGCTASARLARYTVDPATGTADPGSEKIVVDGIGAEGGWCFQFSSHAIGTVDFGADGMLYAGAGDGASFNYPDYGQAGGSLRGTPTPANPCNDRPGARGTALTATASSGGALRSQAVRDASPTGYVSWDGSILRVDPDTGRAPADNPLVDNGVAGDDRIVAHGLRNPFRFGFRPGTDELWLGDVGMGDFEEINKFQTGPSQSSVPNFGWPCYEGPGRLAGYDNLDNHLCEDLYASGTSPLGTGGVTSELTEPYFAWPRAGAQPAAGCSSSGGGSAVGGTFVTSSTWPAALRGAYVFADYVRRCIVAMPLGADGEPDPAARVTLATDATAVQLVDGPGDDIYFVDIARGSVERIRDLSSNVAPVAEVSATPDGGPLPLAVRFDASASRDPDGEAQLGYAWDLDGDGACDDATGPVIERTYTTAGKREVTVCVRDPLGEEGRATVSVFPGQTAPAITSLTSSADSGGWAVGDPITLRATATDVDGPLEDGDFTWSVAVRHCEDQGSSSCHEHPYDTPSPGRSTTVTAPDHDFYAYLRVTLTVADDAAAPGDPRPVTTRTLDVRPRLSQVTVRTEPSGLPVSIGDQSGASDLTTTLLEGGALQVVVPAAASLDGVRYTFSGWADGSTAGVVRSGRTPAGSTTLTARYAGPPGPTEPPGPTDPPIPTDPPSPTPTPEELFRSLEVDGPAGGRTWVADLAGSRTDDVLVVRRGGRATLWISTGDGFEPRRLRPRLRGRVVVGDLRGGRRAEVLAHRGRTALLLRFDRSGRPRAERLAVPRRSRAVVLPHGRRGLHDQVLWLRRDTARWTRLARKGGRAVLRGPWRARPAGRPVAADLDGNGTGDLIWRRTGRVDLVQRTAPRRGGVPRGRPVRVRLPSGRVLVGDFRATGSDQALVVGSDPLRSSLLWLAGRRARLRPVEVPARGRLQVLPGSRDRLLESGDVVRMHTLGTRSGDPTTTVELRGQGAGRPVTGQFGGSTEGDIWWIARDPALLSLQR